jgi:glycosyltransferase involved in cell wall biosynthesis
MSASAGEARQAPTFSFLCTAYLTEAYLADTIESVLAQTRGDWELVVVDNGMSEEIARIVRSYGDADARVRLVRQENRGISGGVNAAAAAAQGRYFVVLHSDDQVVPEYCARVGAALESRPNIDAVGCDAYLFGADGRNRRQSYLKSVGVRTTPDFEHRVRLTELLGGEYLYVTGAIRRASWEAARGYDSDTTPGVEDLGLWLRLLADGCEVRVLPDRLGRYRLREDSESRDDASVERFERSLQGAMLLAAQRSGARGDLRAATESVRTLRYLQALRRARRALLVGDTAAARREAARAFAQRRTVRSAVVLGGLTAAPELLRRIHPAKQRAQSAVVRVLSRKAAPAPAAPVATAVVAGEPAFSFLCSAYRTEHCLAETIESVQAQTRGDWELVVVDNGMSEEIARIVRSYGDTDARVRLVRQENRGISGGVDAAAAAARGRYFVVLHSDDQVLPEYCARIGAVLDTGPEVDLVTCDAYQFDAASGLNRPKTFLRSIKALDAASPQRRVRLGEFLRRQHLYHGATFRRATWEGARGYESGDLPNIEDLTLFLRVLQGGGDARIVPVPLARERLSPHSTSRDPANVANIERAAELAIERAAQQAHDPGDLEGAQDALREIRYQRALRNGRAALVAGDVVAAREQARMAFTQRRTARSVAVLAGLSAAPGVLRRAHPLKQRVSRELDSVAAAIGRAINSAR